MSLPTRAELIERVRANLRGIDHRSDRRDGIEVCADFTRAEIRRAVVAELEALRHRLDPVTLRSGYAKAMIAATLEARISALRAEPRAEQNEQPPVAQRTGASCAPSEPVHARSDLGQNLERAGSTPAPGATCCDRAAQEMEAKMDEELRAVRMEAQALREANASWDFTCQKLIGWIQWRQAWTGGNDPRDLSGTRWDICALRGDAPPRGFMGCMPPPTTAKAGASERERLRDESPAGNVAAPALSDADALERAAEVMERMGSREATPDELRSDAAKLRAANPVDVFELFEHAWGEEFAGKGYAADLMGLARAWFSPLVEALEAIRDGNTTYPHAVAEGALSALRRKAEEAGRG